MSLLSKEEDFLCESLVSKKLGESFRPRKGGILLNDRAFCFVVKSNVFIDQNHFMIIISHFDTNIFSLKQVNAGAFKYQ